MAENTPKKKIEDMTPDEINQLTEAAAQKALNDYHDAIQKEFSVASAAATTSDKVTEYARDFFKNNLPTAAAQIMWLVVNAESESIKLNASKYVVDRALEDAKVDKDPVKQLLEGLGLNSGNAAAPEPLSTDTEA